MHLPVRHGHVSACLRNARAVPTRTSSHLTPHLPTLLSPILRAPLCRTLPALPHAGSCCATAPAWCSPAWTCRCRCRWDDPWVAEALMNWHLTHTCNLAVSYAAQAARAWPYMREAYRGTWPKPRPSCFVTATPYHKTSSLLPDSPRSCRLDLHCVLSCFLQPSLPHTSGPPSSMFTPAGAVRLLPHSALPRPLQRGALPGGARVAPPAPHAGAAAAGGQRRGGGARAQGRGKRGNKMLRGWACK